MCRKWFLQLEEGTALVSSTPSISKEAEIAEQKATCSRISSGSTKAAPGRLECDLQCPKLLAVCELIEWNLKRPVALPARRGMLKLIQNASFRLQILNLFVSRLYRSSQNQMLRHMNAALDLMVTFGNLDEQGDNEYYEYYEEEQEEEEAPDRQETMMEREGTGSFDD